jgi:hypothetical protein
VTITDVPTEAIGQDEAQVLFREAKQRRHRRWIVSGIVACLVTALALVVSVVLVPGGGSGTTLPSHIEPVSAPTCQDTHLGPRASSGGSESSQGWVTIALTNNGPSCRIDGYPLIVAALGHTLSGAVRTLPISVVDGSDYEHHDPGPHPLIIKQGSAVSFDLGSNTASGTVYIISNVQVTVPGASSPLTVSLHAAGSRFPGSPIQLLVTAFVAGSAGPPAI